MCKLVLVAVAAEKSVSTYVEVALELLESVGSFGCQILSCAWLWIQIKGFTPSFLKIVKGSFF